MNKNKALLVFLLLIFSVKVYATCNDKELNDTAEKLSVSFIEDTDYTGKTTDSNGNEIEVNIPKEYAYVLAFTPYNEYLKITATNSLENDISYSEYNVKYNTEVIGSKIHYSPKTYYISIYSVKEDSCNGKLLREFEYTVPSFNEYSLSSFCKDNPKSDICKIDTDVTKLSDEEFNKKTEKIEEENKTIKEKTIDNIKKYWYLILIPIVLISLIYLVRILVYKKKVNKI